MISSAYKNLAQWAMDFALKNGCQACRISISTGTESTFEYRDTQLERLKQASQNRLYMELFVDGRYGSYTTNRINQKELESFIKNGIEATRYLAEDPFRQLPDASRYYKGDGKGLDLSDPKYSNLHADDKLALAKSAVEEVFGSDEKIISVSSSFDDAISSSYMVASNGFEGESESSFYNLYASVSLKDASDARPSAGWSESSLYWDDLVKTNVGRTAFQRASRKLGQQKIASGKYQMLVDNLSITRLLSPLVSAMMGNLLQQKNSFLLNKLDQKVVSDKLTLIDNPHMVKTSGARWFDGEGIATQKRTLFDQGVLKTYFIDTYNSKKMETEPTISGPSTMTMEYGNKNREQMMETIKKGIWVTGFNGGNSNSSSGDFSFGIEGFLVENGKAIKPINEMNITGNLLTLWSNVETIGNDPRLTSSWRIPSILFNDVNFSGL